MMTEDSARIYKLSEDIGGLKSAVEMMMKQWALQETSAASGRKALHDKFETFKDQVGLDIAGLSARVERMTFQLTQMEPSVTAFKERMAADHDDDMLREGARRFRVKVGAFVIAGASAVGWGVHELVNYIKH